MVLHNYRGSPFRHRRHFQRHSVMSTVVSWVYLDHRRMVEQPGGEGLDYNRATLSSPFVQGHEHMQFEKLTETLELMY